MPTFNLNSIRFFQWILGNGIINKFSRLLVIISPLQCVCIFREVYCAVKLKLFYTQHDFLVLGFGLGGR